MDLLKLEENNSILVAVHLRVSEDLDNGNRLWYIAGWHSRRKKNPPPLLARDLNISPLFIKSRSCYWIFPGNKNEYDSPPLVEENEKFIAG